MMKNSKKDQKDALDHLIEIFKNEKQWILNRQLFLSEHDM